MKGFGATEFRYERGSQPLPKVGPWREQLEASLLANKEKAPRERLTLVRIFEDLRRVGYQGSYDAVRRYAQAWRRKLRRSNGGSLCAAELCARRGVSV